MALIEFVKVTEKQMTWKEAFVGMVKDVLFQLRLWFFYWRRFVLPYKTTYLVGSIQACDDGGKGWRENLVPKLESIGIRPIDPTEQESIEYGSMEIALNTLRGYIASGQWDKYDEAMDVIIKRDMEAVYKSDFIVALVDNSQRMGGTVCELWEAIWRLHIPVYVVCYDANKYWSMWMLRTVRKGGMIFNNFAQLNAFLEKRYGKTVKPE